MTMISGPTFEQKAQLLRDSLAATVPLLIREMQGQGGPSEAELEFCERFGLRLGSQGDSLLFAEKGGWHGDAADGTRRYTWSTREMFTGMSRAVATMAFSPGGVTFLGVCYCAGHSPFGAQVGNCVSGVVSRVCPSCAAECVVIRTAKPKRDRKRDKKRGRKI